MRETEHLRILVTAHTRWYHARRVYRMMQMARENFRLRRGHTQKILYQGYRVCLAHSTFALQDVSRESAQVEEPTLARPGIEVSRGLKREWKRKRSSRREGEQSGSSSKQQAGARLTQRRGESDVDDVVYTPCNPFCCTRRLSMLPGRRRGSRRNTRGETRASLLDAHCSNVIERSSSCLLYITDFELRNSLEWR